MKIQDIYKDYGIEHVTEGHKHCREGWVNIACPFCVGNPGYHLGYSLDENYYHCWRCGGKFVDNVLSKILGVTKTQAAQIIRDYGGSTFKKSKEPKIQIQRSPIRYPTGQELKLYSPHARYLAHRGFDPDQLVNRWKISGTGAIAFLDKIDYSRRILIPIYWERKWVSWQSRAILDTMEPKYMACPQEREVIEHQKILYGKPLSWGKRGICVEGVTDVWRMGEKSFAVFGIDFTPYQVKEMVKAFDEIVVLFDPDPQAIKQAKKLIAELKFKGVKAWIEEIGSDPGELSQDDADHLNRQLLTKIY